MYKVRILPAILEFINIMHRFIHALQLYENRTKIQTFLKQTNNNKSFAGLNNLSTNIHRLRVSSRNTAQNLASDKNK